MENDSAAIFAANAPVQDVHGAEEYTDPQAQDHAHLDSFYFSQNPPTSFIPQAEPAGNILLLGMDYHAQLQPAESVTAVATVTDVNTNTPTLHQDAPSLPSKRNFSFRERHDNDFEIRDDLTDCVSVRLRRRRAAENAMSGIAAVLGLDVGWSSEAGSASGALEMKGGAIEYETGDDESRSDCDDGDSEWEPPEADEGGVADIATVARSSKRRKGQIYSPKSRGSSQQAARQNPHEDKSRPPHTLRSASTRQQPKSKALHTCPLCPETFSRRADCDRHLEFYHNSRDIVRSQKFVCSRCSYAFCREDARRRHLMNGCSGRVRKQRARSTRDE